MTNHYHPFNTFALDAFGNRVRIGLTFAETIEFDYLDAREPVDQHGNPLAWDVQNDMTRRLEDRWFELYRKHETACLALVEARSPHLARSPSLSSPRRSAAGRGIR